MGTRGSPVSDPQPSSPPLSLDCMVTGTGGDGREAAVILELKQWDRCGDAGADNLVTTRLG